MAATWIPLQLELTKRCKEAIQALDEPAQLEARRQLSDILKRLTREIRPHNRGMLSAMAAALGRIAGEEQPAGAIILCSGLSRLRRSRRRRAGRGGGRLSSSGCRSRDVPPSGAGARRVVRLDRRDNLQMRFGGFLGELPEAHAERHEPIDLRQAPRDQFQREAVARAGGDGQVELDVRGLGLPVVLAGADRDAGQAAAGARRLRASRVPRRAPRPRLRADAGRRTCRGSAAR